MAALLLNTLSTAEYATLAVVAAWIGYTLFVAWQQLFQATQKPNSKQPSHATATDDAASGPQQQTQTHQEEDDDDNSSAVEEDDQLLPNWLRYAVSEADSHTLRNGRAVVIELSAASRAVGNDDSDEEDDDDDDDSSVDDRDSDDSSSSSSSDEESFDDNDEDQSDSSSSTSSSSDDDHGIEKVRKAWEGMLSVASLVHNHNSNNIQEEVVEEDDDDDDDDDDNDPLQVPPQQQPDRRTTGSDSDNSDTTQHDDNDDDDNEETLQPPPRTLDLWSIRLDYECVDYLVQQVELLPPDQRLQAIDLYDIEIEDNAVVVRQQPLPQLVIVGDNDNDDNDNEVEDDSENEDGADDNLSNNDNEENDNNGQEDHLNNANDNMNRHDPVVIAETMGRFFKANADTLEDMEIGSSSSGSPLTADTIETWLHNLEGMERLYSLSFRSAHLNGASLGIQLHTLLLSCPITTLIFKHCHLDDVVLNHLAHGLAQMPNLAVLKFDHCTVSTTATLSSVSFRGVLVDALLETPHPSLETVSLEDQYISSLWPVTSQMAQREQMIRAQDGVGGASNAMRDNDEANNNKEESLLSKLSRLLQTCPTLGRLDLTNNVGLFSDAPRDHVSLFLKALQTHPSLTQLILDGCGVNNIVATQLFRALQHNHVLERLELWRNPMTLVSQECPRDQDWIACLPHLDSLQFLYMPREMLGDDDPDGHHHWAAAHNVIGGNVLEQQQMVEAEKTLRLERLYQALRRNLSLLRFCILWTNVPDPVEPYMARNRVYGQLQSSLPTLRSTTHCAIWPQLLAALGRHAPQEEEAVHGGHEATLVHAFVRDALASHVAATTTTATTS